MQASTSAPSDDLFAGFYEPLQRAVRASEQLGHGHVDFLDPQAGLAVEWSQLLQRRRVEPSWISV